MKKSEVKEKFPALFAAWRSLPDNVNTPEQKLYFGDFHRWLLAAYPEATKFRSRIGASDDLEQWFDFATHQSWRN